MPKKKRNDTWLGVLAFVLAVISVVCFFTAYQLHAQAKQNSNALPSRVLVGQYTEKPQMDSQNQLLFLKPKPPVYKT